MGIMWRNINGRLLVLSGTGEIQLPSAEEIYASEFSNEKIFRGLPISKPSDQLKDIAFSKYPINIRVSIERSVDLYEPYVYCGILLSKNNKELVALKFSDIDTDHIISEGVWYPLVKGALNEIQDTFDSLSILDPNRLTLKQYISLKNTKKEFLVDKIQESSFSKKDYISNQAPLLPHFNGTLYPYQNQGYHWLKMIVEENAGCILADEMGLGKTAQIIAVLTSREKNHLNPSLVVAPVSLLENWRREVQKFSSNITVLIHQGAERTGFYTEFLKYDLIVTSYETILRDLSIFQMVKWDIVIADEAQAIKNPFAKRTNALKQISRNSSIAVTGTPVENKLEDLWSLTDFVFPSYLGSLKEFNSAYPNGLEAAENLEPLISPILLRRRVKEVATDLPSRLDIPQVLKLSGIEAQQYEDLRLQIVEEYGAKASLVSLIKLRMFCTHPLLQMEDSDQDPSKYSKYKRLLEIVEEILENNEKLIIFTSYQKMTDILYTDLKKRFGVYCDFIDGRIKVEERQNKIDTFTNKENSAILILNPRAAGAGLNITAANHVIHYTLEWNPAIEDQASARAHRRGQTRPVTVYRLYCADTVEEVINEKIEAKRDISDAAVVGTDGLKSDKDSIIDALLRSPLKKEEEKDEHIK